MARNGLAGPPAGYLLRGVQRKSVATSPTSQFDPGCVKTQTLNLRVEFPSRFRRRANQSHLLLLLAEGN